MRLLGLIVVINIVLLQFLKFVYTAVILLQVVMGSPGTHLVRYHWSSPLSPSLKNSESLALL